MTRTIGAGEFKAKCLKLLDEVAATGEALVVTKRGKPVARIEPAQGKPRKTLEFGGLKHLIEIVDPDDNLFSAFDETDLQAWANIGSDLAAGPLSTEPSSGQKRRERTK